MPPQLDAFLKDCMAFLRTPPTARTSDPDAALSPLFNQFDSLHNALIADLRLTRDQVRGMDAPLPAHPLLGQVEAQYRFSPQVQATLAAFDTLIFSASSGGSGGDTMQTRVWSAPEELLWHMRTTFVGTQQDLLGDDDMTLSDSPQGSVLDGLRDIFALDDRDTSRLVDLLARSRAATLSAGGLPYVAHAFRDMTYLGIDDSNVLEETLDRIWQGMQAEVQAAAQPADVKRGLGAALFDALLARNQAMHAQITARYERARRSLPGL